MLQEIDELNNLLSATTEERIKNPDYVDEVLEMLLLTYYYGGTNTMINLDLLGAELDADNADKALNRVIADKTTRQRLEEYSRQGDVESIKRVIRTESHRMFNQGAYDTAKSYGATRKKWVCQMLPDSRDTHIYLNGTEVGIDDSFYTFNGNSTMYPGQFGVAEEDVNCVCELEYKK